MRLGLLPEFCPPWVYISRDGLQRDGASIWSMPRGTSVRGLGFHVHVLRGRTSWCRWPGNRSTKRSDRAACALSKQASRLAPRRPCQLEQAEQGLPTARSCTLVFANDSTCEPYDTLSHIKTPSQSQGMQNSKCRMMNLAYLIQPRPAAAARRHGQDPRPGGALLTRRSADSIYIHPLSIHQ